MHRFLITIIASCSISFGAESPYYDARISGREILTPAPAAEPCITGSSIFGVRPGKPIRFRVSATGAKPLTFTASGVPLGVSLDPLTGWITGRALSDAGDVTIILSARNAKGEATRQLTLRVNDFDLNLATNDEVLAVNQDPLVKQGYRVANKTKEWEIWAKDLADGSKAVALFNLSDKDQVIGVSKSQIGLTGIVRDLWRQKDIGPMGDQFSTMVSPHGVALVKISAKK